MYHLVARTKHGLLYQDAHQAFQLWHRILRACPGLHALCLMPNHIHLQHPRDVRRPLAQAMRGHARSLNAQEGTSGSRIAPLPAAHWAADLGKRRRDTRYIHLNPCRARLVSDPLAWPWSTYRDALGLVAHPVRRVHNNPQSLHRYTSSDPSVSLTGTSLPIGAEGDLHHLRDAVSAYLRVPLSHLNRRGPPRRLLVQAARVNLNLSTRALAAQLSLDSGSVTRIAAHRDAQVRGVERLMGDPRFPGIL